MSKLQSIFRMTGRGPRIASTTAANSNTMIKIHKTNSIDHFSSNHFEALQNAHRPKINL